jgi:hypothetical protein
MKSLIVITLTLAAAFAADKPVQRTKDEHKAEAAKYAARAGELAAQAAKREAAAARLAAQSGNAMAHKWPGLANGPANLERDRAIQARHAEAEAREKHAFHMDQANKTSFDAEP